MVEPWSFASPSFVKKINLNISKINIFTILIKSNCKYCKYLSPKCPFFRLSRQILNFFHLPEGTFSQAIRQMLDCISLPLLRLFY